MTQRVIEMPDLGMGTFRLEGKTAYESVKMALEVGFRHIDTAQIYGNGEQVGQAIKDSNIPRDELFITTKVWNNKLNKSDFIASVKESLNKLQLDSVDLLLIHWPAPSNDEPMSEYLTELLTNQIEVHPYLTNTKLRAFCQQHDIHVTAYMPFVVGKVLNDHTIIDIAKKHDASPAQVVIAWVNAKGMTTIPSSTKRKNLEDNFNDKAVKLARIDALDCGDRQATPSFAPQWDQDTF